MPASRLLARLILAAAVLLGPASAYTRPRLVASRAPTPSATRHSQLAVRPFATRYSQLAVRPSATRHCQVAARDPEPPGSVTLAAFRAWVFTYADTRPYGLDTWEARLFLLSNVGFFAAGGLVAGPGGAPPLGLGLELAGACSCRYHYEQCRLGGTSLPAVQAAMALDYCTALPSIVGGVLYAAELVTHKAPTSPAQTTRALLSPTRSLPSLHSCRHTTRRT